MELKPFIYKQWLQRQALTVTKRDRKRGGRYRVKDAMDAIHAAAHQSDGIDPYDGQPMNASLLETKNPTLSTSQEADQLALARRCPVVKHTRGALICDFEIMSRQTADAKGGMSTEEYIEHCRAVVRYRAKNDFKTAGSVH